jgi:uncharacterized membrane protein YbhN (UPF0104 family)
MDFKKLTEIVGKGIVWLSFGFLIFILFSLDFSTVVKLFHLWWIPLILLLAFLFSLLYFFMAEGWRILLALSSSLCLDKHILYIYLKTVIFKYAPGNVFHFLGRHSLSKSHKLSHETIAFANGIEILLQLFAVSLIIMIGTFFFDISLNLGAYLSLSKTKIFLAFLLLLFIVLMILFRRKYREIILHRSALLRLLRVLAYHLVFLLGSAVVLVAVYAMLFGISFTFSIFVQTIFASSIAWLLGFVVPGAPGGVGIREAILLLLLPSIMIVSKEVVLAGALIYRVVTILGEGLTYFWAKLFKIKALDG